MEFNTSINYFDMTGAAKKLYAKFLEPLCRKWDLSRNEIDVLLFLHNHPGVDRAVDISSGRGMAKSYVSQAVAALEGRGLLQRRFDPADRRAAHLELTESAMRIALEGRQVQQNFFDVVYAGITPEESVLWAGIIRKVMDNIEKSTTRS